MKHVNTPVALPAALVARLWGLALLALAIVSAASLPAQAEDYRIQPGDTLRVEVLEDSSLNRDVLVAPDGRISVPLVGVMRVGNVTLDEAQRRVVLALQGNFATPPNVLISLLRLAGEEVVPEEEEVFQIFVLGEVARAGAQPTLPGSTLLQSLAQAGGPTDFAATKRIQVRRTDPASGTETVFIFNYEEVLEGVSGIGQLEMVEGDVIVVPARRLFE